ncbi:MAG: hypothetical protein M3Q06_09215 [Bacteroidota bacterium]|nr:hypothetical protein [Bacteroidota bacterium]
MTSTTNTNQAPVTAAFVVSQTSGEINVIVSGKKEEEKTNSVKPVSGFAKNTRYSIYNNGGGYTGL